MIDQQTEKLEVLVLDLEDWPEADRAAWTRATTRQHSPFRSRGGGRQPRPLTIRARLTSWGRFLGYLQTIGKLDLAASPGSRVNFDILDDYVLHLQACGNADHTVVSRLAGLRMALQMMDSDSDYAWIVKPRGVSIARHFAMSRKPRNHFHSAEMLEWAEAVFAAGLAHHKPKCRRALIRDAAIIGVLTLPAPRLGALCQFEVGRNLRRFEDGWCIDQNAGITKTHKDEWSLLHPLAGEFLDRYLTVERLELLDGRASQQLWIAQGGSGLTAAGIVTRLRKLSLVRFGERVGPHSFRRSLGTTVATDGYDSPLDATVLLGHTGPGTTLKFYNMAVTTAAAKRHTERRRRLLRQCG